MIKRTWIFAVLAFALASFVDEPCRADIAPRPRDIPAGKDSSPLVVKVDPTKDVSFLRIPRDVLKAAAEQAEKKDTKQSQWSPGRVQSVVAAMAASVGVASVFLLRGRRNTKIAVLFITGVVASAAAAEAWWAPPPAKPIPSTPLNFSGEVVIEASDGFQVELTIGTKPLPQRTGRPGPPPQPREKAT